MTVLPAALGAAKWGAALGLVAGVLYAFGGLVIDLLTVGLNAGTALAFMALVGMPLLFGAVGFLLGGLVAVGARLVGRGPTPPGGP